MNIFSCSFGKDSLASIIIAKEHNISIDLVIYCELMYDNKRNISAEIPEHRDFIYNVAIPKLQQWNIKVKVIRPKKDYLYEFNKIISERTNHPERIGLKRGYLYSGGCVMNSEAKIPALRKIKISNAIEYVGIAADEPIRLARLKENQKSILAEYHIKESETYEICNKYGLLSPIYEFTTRNGCWFCPNAQIDCIKHLINNHYGLWQEFKNLANDPKVYNKYKYGKTCQQIENEIKEKGEQLNLFDFKF